MARRQPVWSATLDRPPLCLVGQGPGPAALSSYGTRSGEGGVKGPVVVSVSSAISISTKKCSLSGGQRTNAE